MRYSYIDAICGAGKTEAAIRHVIRRVSTHGAKFVLMMPTIQLIEQTAKRFKELGYADDLTVIHGENDDAGVVKRIHAFFDAPESSGVLLITFTAWRWVKGRKVDNWHLIVDECPQVFHPSSIDSKSIRDRILPHLEISPMHVPRYSTVSIRKGSAEAIKALLHESRNDDAIDCLAKTAERLHLGDRSYVTTENFEKFSEGRSNSVTFYHVTPPSAFKRFKSVTIMGANFTHSELYRLWGYWGVKFEKKDAFRHQPAMPSVHPETIGRALDIYYLCKDYSAEFKKDYRMTLEVEFRRAAKEVFEGKEFIYTINGSDNPHLLEGVANARYVRPKAHGQNLYRQIDCAAIFAHFNLSTDQAAFLKSVFNLEWKTLWDLRNLDIYYQFICRTSLREVPSAFSVVTPKKILVMDKDMALWLESLFPGSRVHEFKSDTIAALPVPLKGRPKSSSAKSGAQRTRDYREKKKSLEDERKLGILKGLGVTGEERVHGSRNGKTLIREPVTPVTEERRWPVSSMGKPNSDRFITTHVEGFEGLVELLRAALERRFARKEDNQLFNVTAFAMEGDKPRGRKLTDVLYSNAIFMDMDSEENCCPHKFASVFSGVEMVIYSTFSSTPERNRWRVVIPLSRSVSSKEYHSIAKDLIRLADEKGFPFDGSKKNANDFMYLPCQSADKDASFFHHFTGEGRYMLDVDLWLAVRVRDRIGVSYEGTRSQE